MPGGRVLGVPMRSPEVGRSGRTDRIPQLEDAPALHEDAPPREEWECATRTATAVHETSDACWRAVTRPTSRATQVRFTPSPWPHARKRRQWVLMMKSLSIYKIKNML